MSCMYFNTVKAEMKENIKCKRNKFFFRNIRTDIISSFLCNHTLHKNQRFIHRKIKITKSEKNIFSGNKVRTLILNYEAISVIG